MTGNSRDGRVRTRRTEEAVLEVIDRLVRQKQQALDELEEKFGPRGPCSRAECEENDLLEGALDGLEELREELRRPVR